MRRGFCTSVLFIKEMAGFYDQILHLCRIVFDSFPPITSHSGNDSNTAMEGSGERNLFF